MGKRGPSPKPTPIRVLEGNPSRRPINENEPKPTDGIPPMPPHLDRRARVVWRQIVPELSRLGLLTVVDGEALAAYCTAASMAYNARKVLKEKGMTFKTPSGYLQQRPEVSILNKAMHVIKAFAQEFGLTPSARTRLSTEQPEDDLDALLG
jgi:P27 family predicted phage terminase small subunit